MSNCHRWLKWDFAQGIKHIAKMLDFTPCIRKEANHSSREGLILWELLSRFFFKRMVGSLFSRQQLYLAADILNEERDLLQPSWIVVWQGESLHYPKTYIPIIIYNNTHVTTWGILPRVCVLELNWIALTLHWHSQSEKGTLLTILSLKRMAIIAPAFNLAKWCTHWLLLCLPPKQYGHALYVDLSSHRIYSFSSTILPWDPFNWRLQRLNVGPLRQQVLMLIKVLCRGLFRGYWVPALLWPPK